MDKEFDFISKLFNVAVGNPREVEQTLDYLFKKAIFSSFEDKYYKDYLAQQKIIYRVFRNPQGKHKVERR